MDNSEENEVKISAFELHSFIALVIPNKDNGSMKPH